MGQAQSQKLEIHLKVQGQEAVVGGAKVVLVYGNQTLEGEVYEENAYEHIRFIIPVYIDQSLAKMHTLKSHL